MHSNLIKPSKSALKHKPAGNHPYEGSKYPPQPPNTYDQKPYAFVLDSNVQDGYSAYRLNANLRLQSPTINSARIRQGFYGEVYKPDNPQAGPSSSYTMSHPNLGADNNLSSPLKHSGSLTRLDSRLDSWPDQFPARPEYPYYHPKPPLAQNQFPPQEPYNKNRYNQNHALIQKNFLGHSPSVSNLGIPKIPSLHDNNMANMTPGYHAYPQPIPPMGLPMPMTGNIQPKRQFKRQVSTEDENLLRVEQLMKHHNSHLEKLVKNLEEGPMFYTERYNRDRDRDRDNSLSNSPVKTGSRGASDLLNFNSDYFSGKGMKSEEESSKLPEINKNKNSPIKTLLKKILDEDEEDSPNSSRTEGFLRKKKDIKLNLLEKVIKPVKPEAKSSQALQDLKNPKAQDKVNSSPGQKKNKNLDDSEEVPSIELKSSPMKKKGKKKEKKKKAEKAEKKEESIPSIELEKRKEENKRTLKILLWAMVYPSMLGRSVDKDINGRKEKYELKSMKLLQDQRTYLLEFINKHCMNALKNLYKESKTVTLVNEDLDAGTAIPEKELKKRLGIIVTKLSAVMEALNAAITPANFPKSVADFLADISDKSSVMPPKFLTEFEVSCLDISHYGTLKNMNPMRVKLIVGMFVLVKGLIYVFIAQPWTFIPKMKESASLVKKLKAFSSVLYNIIMDFFKENIPIAKHNQMYISPEKRVKSIKNPLSVYTDADDFKKPKPETLQTEVIIGLHTREELKACLHLEKDSVEKLKTLVIDCLEKLYVVVEKGQEEKRKT